MNWKYCFGFDEDEASREFDISTGCGYTFGAFVVFPVVTFYFTIVAFPGLVREGIEKGSIGILSFGVLMLIVFWTGWIFFLIYASWYFSKFRFDTEGIQLRSLFRVKRTIKWSDIRKAAVYNVYWGRTWIGIPFILIFLDLDKRPIELYGDRDGFYKKKYFVMIIATKENIETFGSYWGEQLEKGVQNGPIYGLETHPFEEQRKEGD